MKDKIIFITGVRKGIGEYLCHYYLSKGLIVIGCSRGDCTLTHPSFEYIKTDISIEENVISVFKQIKNKYGKIDYLINNAGINPAILSAPLLKSDLILNTFSTNLFSAIYTSKEAVKMMSRKKFGRIVNIGSMAIKHEVQGEALYTSTKSALLAFTRVLSKEVANSKITVNMLSPSVIKTDLSDKIDSNALSEILKRNAINTFGCFEDVSNVIDFLLSDSSSAVTGQHIYLGGV